MPPGRPREQAPGGVSRDDRQGLELSEEGAGSYSTLRYSILYDMLLYYDTCYIVLYRSLSLYIYIYIHIMIDVIIL